MEYYRIDKIRLPRLKQRCHNLSKEKAKTFRLKLPRIIDTKVLAKMSVPDIQYQYSPNRRKMRCP